MSSDLPVSTGLCSVPHFWIIFEFWRDKGWKEHKRIKLHVQITLNKMIILWVWSLLALLEVLQWDCQMGTLLRNSLRRTQCYSMKSRDCSLSFHECIYLIFTFQRLPGACSVCGGLAFFWLRLYASNNNPSWTTDLGIKGRNLHLLTVLSHLNKFVMLQLLPHLFFEF